MEEFSCATFFFSLASVSFYCIGCAENFFLKSSTPPPPPKKKKSNGQLLIHGNAPEQKIEFGHVYQHAKYDARTWYTNIKHVQMQSFSSTVSL